MKFVFTKHALERTLKRNISRKIIILTVEKPEFKELEDEKEDKIAYYKKLNRVLYLKVIAVKNKDIYRIITFFPIKHLRVRKIKSLIEII